MGDAEGYLGRLERLRQENQQAREEKGMGAGYADKERTRKSRFRKAREHYREKGEGIAERHFISPEIDEAHYFLGRATRGELDEQAIKEIFGENYASKNTGPPYRGNIPSWKTEDKDKKVSGKEIGEYRAEIQAVAHHLMNSLNPHHFMLSARLYSKLGKGTRILPRLLRRAEEAREAKYVLDDHDLLYIKMLIKKREKERQHSRSGLEGKTAIFILSSIAGIALSIYSLTATGNTISNLTGTTQGLLGITFFVIGIAGLVFGRK